MQRPLALVVDKDPALRDAIREAFERQQIRVLSTSSESEARQLLDQGGVEILVLDLEAADIDRMALARRALAREVAPRVVGVAERSSEIARALLALAEDRIVLLRRGDSESLEQLGRQLAREEPSTVSAARVELVGRSEAVKRLRERLKALAAGSGPVGFIGEPGSGKEHAARVLHREGGGAVEAFAATRAEDWAAGDREDWLTALGPAPRAMVYVEGVSRAGPAAQERLAASISRSRQKFPGLRWAFALELDPDQEVARGRLAASLREQLGEIVEVPALRHRTGDVALLAEHFLEGIRKINRLPGLRFSSAALALLERHRWPGNVQELREAIESAVIVAGEGPIAPSHLPESLRRGVPAAPVGEAPAPLPTFREAKREVVEKFEHSYLSELMKRHAGNVTAASQQAGMLRSALQRLLRKYALKSSDFRKPRRPRGAEEGPRPRGD